MDTTALLNEIEQHRDKVRHYFEEGDVENAKYESGVADALQAQLPDAIAHEKDLIAKDAAALTAVGGDGIAWTGDDKGPKKPKKTMAEIVLGPRDKYEGLTVGDRLRVPVDYAVDLPDPVSIQTGFPTTEVEPLGFLGTIGRGTTDATTNTFPQRAPDTNRLVLPTWQKGERKQEFGLQWKQSTFYTQMIAGLMTVSEVTLKNYSQLESIMRTELYNGLERAQHYYSVLGDPDDGQPGIVGILNPKMGVPTFDRTKYAGDTVLDSLRRMTTRVLLTGHVPAYLCLHPLLREYLDLLKVGDGRNDYLGLTINGSVWGLRMVDDAYFADFDDDANAKNAYAMVYDASAATWFTQHGPEFVMERMGEQLAYNETTMRLEGAYGLQVTDPSAFLLTKFELNEADLDLKDRIAPRPRPKDVEVVRYDYDWYEQAGIEAAELGDYAITPSAVYGESYLAKVPLYGGDGPNPGYFMALKVPVGTKVKKDSGTEGTVAEADKGLWGVSLGGPDAGITAKTIEYTLPGEEESHKLAIKVTANPGSPKQGGRVRQS